MHDMGYEVLEFEQDNSPGIALVNSSLAEFVEKKNFPWHLSVLIKCLDISTKQLPLPKEQQVLNAFEDSIAAVVTQDGNAIFLARVSFKGMRELMWRIRNPEKANNVMQNLIGAGENPRPFQYRIDDDPSWEKASWYLSGVTG